MKIGQKEKACRACYGGKGYNLNQLKQAGFKVPEGYIITTEAFDDFMEHNKINYSHEEYLGFNSEIQKGIINGKLRPEVESELASIINNMKSQGIQKFVVRSSAICEDSEEFSMAGMFESYVSLSSIEEILEAIKKCYASLFSDRVLNFLFENEIGFENLKMAVILQGYVPGRVSGVIFTADTINMDSNTLCISAVEGECADFVSGMAQSQNYKVNKITKEYSLENENGDILKANEVKALLEISLKIESNMGYFQDIEWTIYEGNVYILQARAITTFKDKDFPVTWNSSQEENYTWFRFSNIPLYPLMQDIINIEQESISKGAERAVFRLDTYSEGRVINGFFYVRSKEFQDKDIKRKAFTDEVKALFEDGKNIYEDIILPKILDIIKRIEACSEKELVGTKAEEYLQLSLEYLAFTWENHWPAVNGNIYIDIFEEYIKKLNPNIDTENYYDLIFSESKLTKERRTLIEMADIVKESQVLLKLFEECPYEIIIYERLKKLEEGRKLIEKIKSYQKEYKYCDVGMDDILHPAMGERPDYAISGIKNMLAIESKTFYASLNKTKANKQRLIEEIEDKLFGEEIIEFRKKLKVVESSFLTNDNHNFYMERMYRGFLWYAVKEAAELLYNKKSIALKKDINYLYINEIYELLSTPKSVENLIADRKELYKKQLHMSAPEILGTKTNRQQEGSKNSNIPEEKKDGIFIKATSGLNKVVKGKIVRGMPKKLEENSIILLPHCHYDGLMNIIGKVDGLIFNWGSPYDHLGIIAREMNILAMYNAKEALKLLKDGDMVELDGIKGEIRSL